MAEPARVKDVFISYASQNYAEASTIRADLEDDGFTCWFAPEEIRASEDYLVELPAAIKAAKVFLLVLSSYSAASPQVYREVHAAVDDKKPILPVKVDNQEVGEKLRFALTGLQWIDAYPRVGPALARTRSDLRAIFAAQGLEAPKGRPPRLVRVLSSIGSWVMIGAVTALVTFVIHGYWFNLVTPAAFPRVLASNPLPLMIVLATPLISMIMQYLAHARPSAILKMDALFGIRQKGAPLVRTIITLLILAVLLFMSRRVPPTVNVTFQSRSSQLVAGLTRLDNCEPLGYPETTGMYLVTIRVGTYNPEYSLKTSVEFTPPNSVELCQIWADSGFSSEKPPLESQSDVNMPERSRRSHSVELRSSKNGSVGSHRALFTLMRPRTATLSGSVTQLVAGVADNSAVSDTLPVSEEHWK